MAIRQNQILYFLKDLVNPSVGITCVWANADSGKFALLFDEHAMVLFFSISN